VMAQGFTQDLSLQDQYSVLVQVIWLSLCNLVSSISKSFE
jgi:hypothetical protein